MPRFFMLSTLKRRDNLLFLHIDDTGVFYAQYRDRGAPERATAYPLAWLEARVAEGSWVEMPSEPLFTSDEMISSLVKKSDEARGQYDYKERFSDRNAIASQLLHALGYHRTAAALRGDL